MKLSFSWVGLVVFALPMLINIAYVLFPPTGEASSSKSVTRRVEITEAVSRIVCLVLLTFLVNKNPLKPKSIWLLAAVVFCFCTILSGSVILSAVGTSHCLVSPFFSCRFRLRFFR